MNLNLTGKIAMVAASSRGLGHGVAKALAMEGAILSLASRHREAIEEAATRLRSETGATVLANTADMGSADSISAWTEETITQFGGVDILVVNAGGPPTGPFENFDDNAWQSAFEINLLGTVRLIRSAIPSMRARGGGAILTITSCAVKEPINQLILSNVMRSGVTSLVKSLSVELAPHGIRMNNLMPGRIDTDRVRALDSARARATASTPEACKAAAEKNIPLGRYGTTAEFAQAAAFLLSDSASYITGASLAIDGGALKTVW